MAAQASREQRLAIADIVIDNSGTLEDLDRRVDEVWAVLRDRAAARSRGSGRGRPLRRECDARSTARLLARIGGTMLHVSSIAQA